jgi:general secretion pathway protein K
MSAVEQAKERAKKRKKRVDTRGVALVMTLGAVTVLTVFLTELREQTSADLSAALSERDALRAEYYARSAVNLARLLIAIEPEVRKSIPFLGQKIPQIPVWEFTDMVLGPFNDKVGAQSFNSLINADPMGGKNLGLTGGGHYELKIVDEDSKININTAAKSLPGPEDRLGSQLLGLFAPQNYNPLFEGRDADNQFSDRQTICGALIDWADDDENLYACDPHGSSASASKGSEDNFYQMIGLGYRRKNAAYDSLEELRLVRGVSDDFWTTFVDPDPSDAHKRIMTVWGQDKINVNTANAQTLLAITCSSATPESTLCTDVTQMMGFIQGVTLVRSFTMGAPLFTSGNDFIKTMAGSGPMSPVLNALGVQPVKFRSEAEVRSQVGVASKMFSIYATGVVPGFRRTTRVTIHAVVDFRSAQEIGDAFGGIGGGQQQAGGAAAGVAGGALAGAARGLTPPGGGLGGNNQPASQATPEQIAAVMAANPAGNVVYWRVE